MQEHRAAAAGNARRSVVVDLDDDIIEMILARQPVAGRFRVAAARADCNGGSGVLAPGVFGPMARTGRKVRGRGWRSARHHTAQRPECAPGGAAVTFALVGPDAAAAKRDRHRQPARREPAPARIAGCGANPDGCQRAVTCELCLEVIGIICLSCESPLWLACRPQMPPISGHYRTFIQIPANSGVHCAFGL